MRRTLLHQTGNEYEIGGPGDTDETFIVIEGDFSNSGGTLDNPPCAAVPPVLRRSDIYQWVVHGVDPNFLDGSLPPGSHSDGTMLPERHLGTTSKLLVAVR